MNLKKGTLYDTVYLFLLSYKLSVLFIPGTQRSVFMCKVSS